MRTRRSKARYLKVIAVLTIIVLVFVFGTVYFKKNVVPVVMNSSINRVRAIGTNALNSSVTEAIKHSITYDDLFEVLNDSNGRVMMIKANSPNINRIAIEVKNTAQKLLDELGVQEIKIAFGTFTGIALLTGFGPEVTIKAVPIGSASCDFVSKFVTAGINQTVHQIYIEVFADIAIITPIDEPMVSVKTEILVCENLIVGEIPEIFATLNPNDSFFDLVP